MKLIVKYWILGFFLLLLNVTAIRAYIPAQSVEKYSEAFYDDTENNAIELFNLISTTQLCEEISFDHQSLDVKYILKSQNRHNKSNNNKLSARLDKSLCPMLHSNSIQYYIYTLEKIIT